MMRKLRIKYLSNDQVLSKIVTKSALIHNQKMKVEITMTHNQERRLKYLKHRINIRNKGGISYQASLCKWLSE